MPICREIRCKEPEKLLPITTKISTHSVGGVAHYNCPRGYYIEGNETRICMQNGSWSGFTPVCYGKFYFFSFPFFFYLLKNKLSIVSLLKMFNKFLFFVINDESC